MKMVKMRMLKRFTRTLSRKKDIWRIDSKSQQSKLEYLQKKITRRRIREKTISSLHHFL